MKPEARAKPWTDEEDGIIQDTRSRTAREVSEMLPGRSVNAIQKRRITLSNGFVRIRQPWTEAEDEIIRQIGSSTSSVDLVKYLPGRTAQAIKNRRRSRGLGVRCINANELNPWFVGSKPLLAKTCRNCGLLLPSDWFCFEQRANNKGWHATCRKCESARGKQRPKRPLGGDRLRQWAKKAQALTLPGADRTNYPYTEADHKVLADESLTTLGKALLLHRTYAATKVAVQMNDYKSHRPIVPDPRGWAFTIHNHLSRAEIDAITQAIKTGIESGALPRPEWDWDDELEIAS